ncbi:MAG: type III pantothenate kinase [Planctomycetota bacterium]
MAKDEWLEHIEKVVRWRRTKGRFGVFTLNIGNTNTTVIGSRFQVPPYGLVWKTGAALPLELATVLNEELAKGAPVVLAGVVPQYKEELAATLRKLGHEVLIFRQDLEPEIEIVPQPAERVGDDRIADAMGALAQGPGNPWVIVDVGTAMTINAVTPRHRGRLPRFEGGLILPGAAACLRALAENTAQLPLLARWPEGAQENATFIGKSTEQAMLLGVYHAQVTSAISLAKGQMRELGPRTRVILTGGGATQAGFDTEFLASFPPGKAVLYAQLVHLGLAAAWMAWDRARPPAGA